MTELSSWLQRCQLLLQQRQLRLVLLSEQWLDWGDSRDQFLVLDDQRTDRYAMHRYRDFLGGSNQRVLLNCSQRVHADALAALAGTVSAGGLLVVNLPTQATAFSQRLLTHAEPFPLVAKVSSLACLPAIEAKLHGLPVSQPAPAQFPNHAQQQVIAAMLAQRQQTHLLMADRGRGKSTSLGAALAQYTGSDRLVVTAPKRSQVDSLLQQAANKAEFIAWERLLELPADSIRLVIDEAAGLPIHILQQLCQKFRVWGIATTVEGYEGCGRGFVIRFVDWLTQHCGYQNHTLTEPVRWRAPDDCEAWLNQTLCLQPIDTPVHWDDGFHFSAAATLSEGQLHQVMQLLLEAHYQSSPNDLRLLLDDDQQQLLLYCQHNSLVGVIWLATEGPVPESLQGDILAGTRRPPGALLPQALSYQWQCHAPMQWRWWRVVRIAIPLALRRQHYGTRLLQQLLIMGRQYRIDAIGSSFGAAPEVLTFWQANDFRLVHQGTKRQMASGYVNAMVAVGLTPAVNTLLDQQLR